MTIHVRLQEWRSTGPKDSAGSMLAGAFLERVTDRALVEKLARAGVLEVTELRDGLRVQAFAHVGRIQLGDLVVTIVPKVGTTELLELVRYAYGFGKLSLYDATAFSTVGRLLQDLLVAQLIAEVSTLAARGLSRTYVATEELLASPRGRVDMRALAARMPLTEARLPCRSYVRSADHLLNRVLLGGVQLAVAVSHDPGLRRSARAVASRMQQEVSSIRLSGPIFERARRKLDRLTTAYAPALRLTELLWACQSISMDGESTTPLSGFLFDMNRFFQALMGRFLAEHVDAFEVREEHALKHMMRYVPGLNPRRKRAPTPRPDFVVASGRKVVALLDAKYRDLWEQDLPREMLYQLAMYTLSQRGVATAAILYPTAAKTAREAVVEIRDPVGEGALGYVALRPVILSELVEALRAPNSVTARQLAQQYAFGGAAAPTKQMSASA